MAGSCTGVVTVVDSLMKFLFLYTVTEVLTDLVFRKTV
jgi:hypothetical protein